MKNGGFDPFDSALRQAQEPPRDRTIYLLSHRELATNVLGRAQSGQRPPPHVSQRNVVVEFIETTKMFKYFQVVSIRLCLLNHRRY